MEIDLDSDIILTNKGSVPRTDQFPNQQLDLKQQLAKHMLPVGSYESPISDELKLRLEENTIPNNEIDPRVLSIKIDIVQYFKKHAESEGQIGPEDNFDLKIVFVKPEFFGEEKETKGNYFPLERVIVVCYPSDLDETDMFKLSTTIFHEARHAVSEQAGVVHLSSETEVLSPGELPYDEASILVGLDRISMSSEFDLLEEVYTEGFTADNIGTVENSALKKALTRSIEIAKKQNLDPKLITSYKKKTYGIPGFEESGYTDVLRIYYSLKEKIPNILDLFTDIRTGKAGSKGKLAKEIISHYDKDVLASLIRGVSGDAAWIKLLVGNKK